MVPPSDDLATNRELWGALNQAFTDADAEAAWASDRVRWGLFGIPEDELGVLGDVGGLSVLEVGSGTAYLSAWLVRLGATAVAVDLSEAQLATARRRQDATGPRFPLVQANGEQLPLAAASFDLVVSEHGAAAWCDPELWVAEAARVLRRGGRLVFLTNSLLSALCVPEAEGPAGDRLLRGQRETYTVRWPGGGREFHPSHGKWLDVLRRNGFVVDALHELYAPADSADHVYYEIVSAEWAARWPSEELWVAHLDG